MCTVRVCTVRVCMCVRACVRWGWTQAGQGVEVPVQARGAGGAVRLGKKTTACFRCISERGLGLRGQDSSWGPDACGELGSSVRWDTAVKVAS